MKFEVDKQTLKDLAIEETTDGTANLFNIFNEVSTYGGRLKLKTIFSAPTTDIEVIKGRQNLIKYLQTVDHTVFVLKNDAEFIEFYLSQNSIKITSSKFRALENAIMSRIVPSNDYYVVKKGLKHLLSALKSIHSFISKTDSNHCSDLLDQYRSIIVNIFKQDEFASILKLESEHNLKPIQIGYYDKLFRSSAKNELRKLLDIIYELDCFMAVAKVSSQKGYCFPDFLIGQKKRIAIKGLYHPFLSDPIDNDIDFDSSRNVVFLTGANMAGKSTFLKSLGISLYLAHLGFPVPARSMETSMFNGIITTINLFDNLQQGYSHFYSEVIRVKEVAEKINSIGNMFVIFDELFRGTNVKDAYEGSVAIIKAFLNVDENLFVISTHIAEVAEQLKESRNVHFVFFESEIKNGIPYYSYKIHEGVSHERLGMVIIKKERIIEIIENQRHYS